MPRPPDHLGRSALAAQLLRSLREEGRARPIATWRPGLGSSSTRQGVLVERAQAARRVRAERG
jgi:hypothetical protein